MSVSKCRKCGSFNLESFVGTNGASFLRCQQCGHKKRHGLDANAIRAMIRQEMGTVAPQQKPTVVPPTATQAVQSQSLKIEDIAKHVGAAVEKQMVELRQLAAIAIKPTVVEVHHEHGKSTVIEGAHYMLPRVLRLLRAGFHVYLWGDAGTGKTTAALMAAEQLKLEAEIDTFDPTTFRSTVQGFLTPKGEASHTAFSRCWTDGKLYVADEIDNAPGYLQTLFNSALANEIAPLAWGNVKRHKKCGFCGTGNTPGRPTRAFPDRKPMSAAFADRLYFMHWPLDAGIEARAAGLPYTAPVRPAAEKITKERWVKFVVALRAWAKVNCPTLMITPRASLLGLKALELGESWQEVADALIFRGADEDIRTKALNAVKI